MNASAMVDALREICADVDAGRVPRRITLRRALAPIVVPAALGIAVVGGAGCGAAHERPGGSDPEICDNGVDDDGDDAIDCADEDCDAEPLCEPLPVYSVPFEDCDDEIDNDGNGLVDCADPQCSESDLCGAVDEYGAPFEHCCDGVDNDGDGRVDCGDVEDCIGLSICPVVLAYGVPLGDEVCEDGIDNDGDTLTDYEDPDCSNADCFQHSVWEWQCDDGLDNDGDGFADCVDPDCAPYCNTDVLYGASFEDCCDGLDNDGNGLVDCLDVDSCGGLSTCSAGMVLYGGPFAPEVCDNEEDDDFDGLVDSADPDCAQPGCLEGPAFEMQCGDDEDNDGDGFVDCADPDCGMSADCGGMIPEYGAPFGTPEICDDRVDNDRDFLVDCNDPDCVGHEDC